MKPCRTTTSLTRCSRLDWFLYTYAIWRYGPYACAYRTGNTFAILLRTRDICSIYVFRNIKILQLSTTNGPKHVSICFQCPSEWGIAINHILEPCEVPRGEHTEVKSMEKKHLLLPNREGFDNCRKLSIL